MTFAMQQGIDYEDEALRVYNKYTNNRLVQDHIGFMLHKKYNWLGATLDAVCADKPILIEVKTVVFKREHPEFSVPNIHWPQLQIQMEVANINTIHYVKYAPGSLFNHGWMVITEVKRDRSWFCAALPYLEAFYFWYTSIRTGQCSIPERKIKSRKKRKLNEIENLFV